MFKPYDTPTHPANGPEHHTGKPCIEGCGRPAGTAWSPLWCQPCNAARIRRIDESLRAIAARLGVDVDDLSPPKENSLPKETSR